jgi:hypothetical protein
MTTSRPWEIEAGPLSIMGRLGWSRDTLHVGDAITVIGSPSRDAGKRSLHPNEIKRGDATLFDRKGEMTRLASADAAPSAATTDPGLDGIWVTLLALAVEDALDPEILSLTAEGAAAFKHFDEKKMHPGAKCLPNPAPVFMITPDLKRITRGDGVILIDGEFDGAQRTIHLNVPTHEGASESIQGHSIGRGGWLEPDLSLRIDGSGVSRGSRRGRRAVGVSSQPEICTLEM